MPATLERTLQDDALDALRRHGNPFRNYFARNPDDEVCSRYHVADLYGREREQLFGLVELYRLDPTTHSEIVPVLGNKGAGKTHLLHSVKHGHENGWQLLVTPGTFQKGTDFLEYLLFQIIDTLLGGGKQRGARPIEFIGEELTRRLLRTALTAMPLPARADLFPAPTLARWARKLGFSNGQAEDRAQWLIDTLGYPGGMSVKQACREVGLDLEKACEIICAHVDSTEPHNTGGQLRRHIYQGFTRAALLGVESNLASFLTFGFAELEYHVRPSRQDLVLSLMKVLMEVFLSLKVPVVVAFDQLEDLLLARRTDDGHKVSEAFFAGIVQVMHQVDGICFLVFAERGLWNRFIPSLDGYIQDRLNNPVHIPKFGTIKALRLEPPTPQLVWQVVAARLRPALEELGDLPELSPIFPFTDEQVARIARTEPTLRDMLQQFRHLFDHLVSGTASPTACDTPPNSLFETGPRNSGVQELPPPGEIPAAVKSVVVLQMPGEFRPAEASPLTTHHSPLTVAWKQELQAAGKQLEPEGALTGATRELQAGLGTFLHLCHEHGVKVGRWRLQHVVPEYTFGDHPTYGVMTIAHWTCKDGKPWRVGIGLFLGRGPGKPKDLQIKLSAFDSEPSVIDHLILLRPADDANVSGKSKSLLEETERSGRHTRLEPVSLDELAALYAFPRWLTALTESLPEGQPLPPLGEFLQAECSKLLERVCMPSAE